MVNTITCDDCGRDITGELCFSTGEKTRLKSKSMTKKKEFDPVALMQRFQQYGFSEKTSEKIYDILYSYEYDIGIVTPEPTVYYPDNPKKLDKELKV